MTDREMRSRLFLLLFFWGCVVSLWAQSTLTLSGTVTDEKGEGIPYATVAVHRANKGTHTDSKGRYTLALPEGEYVLNASAIGYKTMTQTAKGKGERELNFVLSQMAYGLDEVEVVGSTEAKKMNVRGYSVSSLEMRSLAPSVQSLTGVLKRVSGVRIREEGGVGSDYNFVLNGLSGNAVRYFVDGVPIDALGKGFSLSNLPINLIERIDIYKGVVPVELGEDALGGAVNIITKREGHNYFDATISYGSFQTFRTELTGQYALPHSGFMIRPTVSFTSARNNYLMRGVELWDPEAHEYRKYDMPRFHDRYRSFLGQVEAGFQNRPWADEAFVTLSGVTSHKEIQTGEKQTIVVGEGLKDVTSLGASLRYVKRNLLTPGLTARLLASYTSGKTLVTDTAYRSYNWDGTWDKAGFTEVTRREKSIRHYDRPQVTLRANLAYEFGFGGSVDFNYLLSSIRNNRYDDLDQQFVPTSDLMDKHTMSLSYSQAFLGDRLSGTLFLKDYLFRAKLEQKELSWKTGYSDKEPESSQNNVGYGATLRYTFYPELLMKASYETSVRLPMSYEFLGNGLTVIPNFKLRPEQSHNFNLSFYGTTSFGERKHRLSYEVSGFGRVVSDYIIKQPVGDSESQYTNIYATNVFGAEAEVNYSFLDEWHATVNATYLDERNNTKLNQDGKPELTKGNRLPNRPYFYANFLLGWDKRNPFHVQGHRLNLSYSSSFVQWYYLSWEAYGSKESKQVIPIQFPQNLSATWYTPGDRFSLSLECANLLDQTIYDNYMLQNPGRTFSAKLRIFLR